MMVGALHRMLMVLEPDQDWRGLGRVYNRLKKTAAPSRDKLSCMVPASELLDLGIGLMDTCDRGQNETYKATRYRDGLNIALLICCPVRLKNLAGLMVSQHLVFDGQDYQGEAHGGRDQDGQTLHCGGLARADPLHRALAAGPPTVSAINGNGQAQDGRHDQPPVAQPLRARP